MNTYISFDIKALEPIKMGAHGSQSDTEYALGYIAGSTIRGAFIHAYLQNKNISNLNDFPDIREKLLGGKYKFLHAYPKIKGKRALPFPKCFYSNKEEAKKYEGEGILSMINEFHHSIDENCVKVSLGEFCSFETEEIVTTSAKKIFNLHISKKEKDNKIYRYEALKAGQIFSALISIDNAAEDEIVEITNLLEGQTFYFGGSKGSGYGKSVISNVTILNDNPERFTQYEVNNKEFYIYATSDIISRNEYGQFIGWIDEKFLLEKLQLESVKFQQSSVLTQVATGYNNTWECRLPQTLGIKAGSIFKYEFTGELSDELIVNLMDKGIGDRREEGFGRIMLLPNLDYKFAKSLSDYTAKKKLPENYSKQEAILLDGILTRIYKSTLEKDYNRQIVELSKVTNDRPLNHAQLGKLIELTVMAQANSPQEGKKMFITYFEQMQAKTSRKSYNQFEDSRIHNIKLTDYLINFINDSDNVEKFNGNQQYKSNAFKIQQIEPKLNASFVYQSNMQFLEQFLRYRLRVKKGVK